MHEISGSNCCYAYFFKSVLYWYIRVYASIYASEMSCRSINIFVVVCTCLCLDKCGVFYFSKYIPVYTNMAIHIHRIYFNMFSILYYILFTTISYHAIVYGGMGVWP